MKIEIGNSFSKNIESINSDSVRFVAEDGRTMFEVKIGKDGKSIEILGIETCKVGGVLYSDCIDIRPRVGNCIEVLARRYSEK